jgi:hypothetical protein
MQRRDYLLVMVSAATIRAVQAATPAPATLTVQWRVARPDFQRVNTSLPGIKDVRAEPVSANATRGLPVMLIITAISTVAEIADVVIRICRDLRGGTKIVSVNGSLDIKSDASIPSGTIVVAGKDGATVYQSAAPSADDLVKVIDDLRKTTVKPR